MAAEPTLMVDVITPDERQMIDEYIAAHGVTVIKPMWFSTDPPDPVEKKSKKKFRYGRKAKLHQILGNVLKARERIIKDSGALDQ